MIEILRWSFYCSSINMLADVIMKVILLLAMIMPSALSTSRIQEMQVHTGTYPGSQIQFNGNIFHIQVGLADKQREQF